MAKLLDRTLPFVVIAGLVCVGSCVWITKDGRSGTAASPDDAPRELRVLPSGARDINYRIIRGLGSVTYFDCALEEKDFRQHAKQGSWELEEISRPVKVLRYGKHEPGVIVTQGLNYQRIQKNNGGLRVTYDRESRRMYYSSSAR
ncbi:MAG: hypothetical protein HN849_14525 [Victivallales bacterium]|nr:hypothetical protein [Victivallales bacterium]